MNLVPRQLPDALARANVRFLGRHAHGCRNSHNGHDQLRGHDQFVILRSEEGEAVVSPAHVLDASQPRDKHVWHGEQFQHFPLLVHTDDLRNAPRADLSSTAHETICTSVTVRNRTEVGAYAYQGVNGLVPATADGSAQVADQRPRHDGWHSGADDYAALGLTVGGAFEVYVPDYPDHIIPDFQIQALNEIALDNDRLRQWSGRDHFCHRASPNEVRS